MNFLSVLAVVVSLTHYASAQTCSYVMKSGDTILSSVASGNPYVACAWINANGVDPCSLKAGQCLTAPSATTSTTCPSWCSSACCPSTYGYNGVYYPTYGSYGYNTGTTCGYGQYQVQYGNTFWNLGGQTNAGMCAWLNANPTVDPCNLKVGQCINQPAAGTSYTCYSSSYYYNNYNGWSYSCSNSIPSGTYGSYSGPYYNGYNGYNSGTGYNNGGYVAPSNSCNCGANQYCVQSGDTFCALALRTGLSACDWQGANSAISATGLQVGQCINNPVNTGYRAGYCSIRC